VHVLLHCVRLRSRLSGQNGWLTGGCRDGSWTLSLIVLLSQLKIGEETCADVRGNLLCSTIMSNHADVAAEAEEVPAPPTPTPPPPSKIVSPSVSLHASISPSIQPSIRSFLLLLPLLLFHVCISLRYATNAGRVSLTHSRYSMSNAHVRPWPLHGCGAPQLPWLTMHLSTRALLAYRPSMTVVQRRMAGNLKKWVLKNLLPVSLVCAVALGAAWPTPGVAVGSKVDGNSPAEIACVGNAHLPRLQSTCLLCTHPLQTSRNWFVIRLFCTHVAFHHCCVTSCARFTTDN
jgi:hypothetical protein